LPPAFSSGSAATKISEQLSTLADHIGEWRDGMESDGELAADDGTSGRDVIAQRSGNEDQRSQSEIAEEALTLKEIGTVS
jgi:hypothetical protein